MLLNDRIKKHPCTLIRLRKGLLNSRGRHVLEQFIEWAIRRIIGSISQRVLVSARRRIEREMDEVLKCIKT